jgi:hypothetical protein
MRKWNHLITRYFLFEAFPTSEYVKYKFNENKIKIKPIIFTFFLPLFKTITNNNIHNRIKKEKHNKKLKNKRKKKNDNHNYIIII